MPIQSFNLVCTIMDLLDCLKLATIVIFCFRENTAADLVRFQKRVLLPANLDHMPKHESDEKPGDFSVNMKLFCHIAVYLQILHHTWQIVIKDCKIPISGR